MAWIWYYFCMAIYAQNKKARHDYEILDEYEAGIELKGFEVKSIKLGRASLKGARVVLRGGEAFLIGANIPPYQAANTPKDYDPERARRLILTKKEINKLLGKEQEKGLTLPALLLYNKGRLIKLRFAVARGKKKYDKREQIKKRDQKRDIERSLKYKLR